MLRLALAALALAALAACSGEGHKGYSASPEEVARAAYVHDGPPALTLYTVVSNRTGGGGHTALMVNGPQRVIFDPAGSFHHEEVPRMGDVLYGITPAFQLGYESMHARETYHVVAHRVEVSPEIAARAYQLVTTNGPVSQTQCASATARVLKQLPGFEDIRVTLYPVPLMESFERITGAQPRRYYEDFTPPSEGG